MVVIAVFGSVLRPHERIQLHALAYDRANVLRTRATPEPIKDWSLTSPKMKLVKMGAKLASDQRYVGPQLAEVAIHRQCSVRFRD